MYDDGSMSIDLPQTGLSLDITGHHVSETNHANDVITTSQSDNDDD